MNEHYIMILPHLGEGVESADVSEVLVSPGDKIKKDDPVVVLESEKASMEIPADISGTVMDVFLNEGALISAGDKIISIQHDKTEKDNLKKHKTYEKEPQNIKDEISPKKVHGVTSKQERTGENFRTSPSVRKLARELIIDLAEIRGTGKKGRITRDDLINEIKKRMTTTPGSTQEEIDFSQWGQVEYKPLTKIKKITGKRLESAWQSIPQVTQFDKADITELDEFRKKMNEGIEKKKITFLPFLINAAVKTLKEFPDFNCSLSAGKDTLIHKNYYHIGIAVDTSAGLVVPVVKDAEKKDIKTLSKELSDISKRARQKTLKPDEFKGGTFTISSLGGIGGTYFTPIINPPQVAVLGVSRAIWEPVFSKSENDFHPRFILPYSLTYDHRVIDGAAASAFTKYMGDILSDAGSFI